MIFRADFLQNQGGPHSQIGDFGKIVEMFA